MPAGAAGAVRAVVNLLGMIRTWGHTWHGPGGGSGGCAGSDGMLMCVLRLLGDARGRLLLRPVSVRASVCENTTLSRAMYTCPAEPATVPGTADQPDCLAQQPPWLFSTHGDGGVLAEKGAVALRSRWLWTPMKGPSRCRSACKLGGLVGGLGGLFRFSSRTAGTAGAKGLSLTYC